MSTSTAGYGQAQLHQREQRMATRQELGLVAVLGEQGHGLVGRAGPDVVECGGDHERASWIAAHTRLGEAGMSMSVMPRGPRASTTAFITAAAEPIVPASPMPFTPRGLVGLGVTVWSSVYEGASTAEGTR